MKRMFIILALFFVLLTVGISILGYYMNTRVVSFSLTGEGYEVSIFTTEDSPKLVKAFTTSEEVRLNKGEYTYTVSGKNFDDTAIPFTVTDEATTVTVTPEYSFNYLSELLETERDSIMTIINVQFTAIDFSIEELALYEKGDWAAGVLTTVVDPRELPDRYRFVLHKKDTSWEVVIPPTIAINKAAYKTVPESVLYDLYSAN